MKILLTGTGAADGIPAFFADSRVSQYAREHKGKDLRTRASAVVDDILRLDFGPDTFAQCQLLGVRPFDWKYIAFTHSHDDHFAPKELQYMFPPFVSEDAPRPIILGNQAILDGITSAFSDAVKLDLQLIQSFRSVNVGEYEITPIRAYHKLDEDSLNLIIKRDKTLLYATDTGVWQEPTWEFLEGWRFDAIVMEATDGFNPTEYWGHLSAHEMVAMVNRLREMGCAPSGIPIATTHHSHAGLATHAELREFFEPLGITVGFDGMQFSF